MMVAIIVGFVVTFITYFLTVFFGKPHRMSGSFLYDLFMGATLNPRILNLDLKVFISHNFIFWFFYFFNFYYFLFFYFLFLYFINYLLDLGRDPCALGHSLLRECVCCSQTIRAIRIRLNPHPFHVSCPLVVRQCMPEGRGVDSHNLGYLL